MAKEKKTKKEKVKKVKSKNKKRFKLFRKIGRFIYSILAFIYGLIDKFIVTPLAKIMLWIQKQLEGSGKIFDRLLSNKVILITLALGLAILSFFGVYGNSDLMANRSEDIIYGQELKALYNAESYVVEGLPKKVDITLIGSKSATNLAKQSVNKEVTIDLTGKKPGTYTVPLKYSGSKVSNVAYKIDPSEITVYIYDKITTEKTIKAEIVNEDKLDSKLIITNIKFDKDKVFVKSSQQKIDKVALVKAIVNIDDLKKVMKSAAAGKYELSDIKLVAYDEEGKRLNVEIVPASISATIEVKSPSKEVSLKAVPQGNVVFGKSIENITLSENKVTIYGEEAALDKISSIPVDINVEGLSKSHEYKVNIPLPSGVREMSTKSVTAKVTLADITEKTIDDVGITIKNLGNGLIAQAASKDDSVCSVIVKGTSTNIKNVSAENITATVDLQGITEAGNHKVKVIVTGDDTKLTYTPKTETVTVKISRK